MPTVTCDGQTLLLDGQRIWLVSGTIHASRIAAQHWPARLAAAKEAGLNCIEVPAVWSVHEPRQGKFDFSGDADLPEFIRLAGRMGLRVLLRAGPYVGDGYDLGGIPPWVLGECDRRIRGPHPGFLRCCAQWLSELCDRIRPLQATGGPGGGKRSTGPIVAVQLEHHWHCGHGPSGEAYLGELIRYLREGGINVPVLDANNLFYSVEGNIEGWTGFSHLHANLRQLRHLRPAHPRIVVGLESGVPAVWGRTLDDHTGDAARSIPRVLHAMAETLGACGQFNLGSFCPGAMPGFSGGRAGSGEDSGFAATVADHFSMLDQGGGRTALFHAVKPLCTFASSFERVLCGLDPTFLPAVISADSTAAPSQSNGRSRRSTGAGGREQRPTATALHCTGAQGSIVFVCAPPASDGSQGPAVVLTLPDGSTLPVETGRYGVAWILLDVHLGGRATLDYCNLNPFALTGRTLVLFGPAGAPGLTSINGSAFEIMVPQKDEPVIEEHEGITIVVCNERTIDAACATREGIHLGVSGLNEQGIPLPHPAFPRRWFVDSQGKVSQNPSDRASVKPTKLAFSEWSAAAADEYVEGSSARFARIDGPTSLESLGTPTGYGWMRLRVRSAGSRKPKVLFASSADRLHLFAGGDALCVLGEGPGSEQGAIPLPLTRGENVITALCDNLGRGAGGWGPIEPKGIAGHLWEVSAFRAGTATVAQSEPVDPFSIHVPLFGLQEGDRTDPRRLTWKFQHRRRSPIFVHIDACPVPAVLLVNGAGRRVIGPGSRHIVEMIPEDAMSRGTNTIQLAFIGDGEEGARALKGAVSFLEGVDCLSSGAGVEWAFAKWEMPEASAFRPVRFPQDSGTGAVPKRGRPAWWKGRFSVPGGVQALFLDAKGLSKGQLFLNGRNLCRYWVATRTGKAVPPQSRYLLPGPWLRADAENELAIFDEHGFSPEHCRLVYDDAT